MSHVELWTLTRLRLMVVSIFMQFMPTGTAIMVMTSSLSTALPSNISLLTSGGNSNTVE